MRRFLKKGRPIFLHVASISFHYGLELGASRHQPDLVPRSGSQNVQFRLVIPRHDVHSKSYRDKVDIFRAGRADSYLLDLDRVDIVSGVGTEVPTGVQTPVSQPATVMVGKKLGEGSFAVVYQHVEHRMHSNYPISSWQGSK
jgi:hypothetical protein